MVLKAASKYLFDGIKLHVGGLLYQCCLLQLTFQHVNQLL